MYITLLVLLVAFGGALVFNGAERHRPKTLLLGSLILLLTGLFFALLSFWGEMLWFEELNQSERFWTGVFAQVGFAALGALAGGLGVFILTLPITVPTPLARIWPAVAGALSGGLWGCWNWQIILKYLYQVSTEIRDPILQRDAGFYLFSLPFYDSVYWGLLLIAALVPAVHGGLAQRLQGRPLFFDHAALIAIVIPWLDIFGIWFLSLGAAPVLVQWLRVQPNEITLEAHYIAYNIELTRRGFQLHKVEEREFPVSPTFTRETLSNNQYLLSEVRLWDWRALEAVYKQFQEIRLYYEFADVDVDR